MRTDLLATVAVFTVGILGCAATGSESSAPDCTTAEAISTDGQEKAVIEGPCSALSADNWEVDRDPGGDLEEANPVCMASAHSQAMEAQCQNMEPIGEVAQNLTPRKWQEICTLGCALLAGAGCASVTASCTAGAIWSFGGVLIPCAYAVAAACTASVSVTVVCGFKCAGG